MKVLFSSFKPIRIQTKVLTYNPGRKIEGGVLDQLVGVWTLTSFLSLMAVALSLSE